MVRFARAEGSKGCNKKVLEEATPWEEMVGQAKAAKNIQDDVVKESSESENIDGKKKKRKKSIENITDSEIKTESATSDVVKKKKKKVDKENGIENNIIAKKEGNVDNKDVDESEMTLTNDETEAGDKKKKRRKKKGGDAKKAEASQEFKINAKGQRVKVFKDGKERTWFDLPYEDGERMTRYKNMWVKKEMVTKLDELQATLSVQEQDSKVVMRKMMKAIRKAHKELRFELIYEQRNILMKEIRAEQGKDLDGKKNRKQKQAALEKEKKLAKKEKQKKKKLKDKQKSDMSADQVDLDEEKTEETDSNLQSNQVNSEKGDVIAIQNESMPDNELLKEDKIKIHTKFDSDDETREGEESQNEDSNTIGIKRKNADRNSDVNGNDEKNKPHYELTFEENDLMIQFEGWWVKKEVVPKLTAMQNEKIRKILAARADRSTNSELTAEEKLTLNRFMKKAKRGENRQLKIELIRIENRKAWKAKGEEIKITKKLSKPGKDLGINYDEENDMVKFDGFWVKKESADRLNRLRGRLQSEGVSDEELKAILQRERRKEERLLKNERKLVCFNCRKPGHMVSACPNVMTGSNQEDITICFKCGSTEHMARECKVQKKGSEYSHATCFICKEAGHISRECPDNPRGLYPQGGACKHCGSVEHLWRDCPEHKEESESNTLKASCIDGTAIEALDEVDMEIEKPKKKKAKVIQFD
ncbi:unnamed protein product [Meganyctiphanes norvegica]|uniref:CCHC-type domain-containing protein n=1 Tax=Meganyctiphanes norvegica TaxID=48144 RepID=A0AAV2RY96_MEGNR